MNNAVISGGGISKPHQSKISKSLKNKIKKTTNTTVNATEQNATDKKKTNKNETQSTVHDNLKTIDSTENINCGAIDSNTIKLKPVVRSYHSKIRSNIGPSVNTNSDHDAITIKTESDTSKISKKAYVGFEPQSIKTIWEQHNHSDVELTQEVCERVAEDVSYKVWELISQIKTYARHSAGRVTAALVNEVLRDHDVPPALGAADSDWDCIKSDGIFYFHLDKVLELRDEYRKDVTVEIPNGPDFQCSWPLEAKCNDLLKKYITNLIYACAYGDADAFDITLKEVSFSPIIGAAYRMLLAKLIQILAFKQHDELSSRIWRFLRACSSNQYSRDLVCREEYLHLSEILICQLLATNESIKTEKTMEVQNGEEYQKTTFGNDEIKVEIYDVDMEPMEHNQSNGTSDERIYKLLPEEDDKYQEYSYVSPYFATPVNEPYVWELCDCLGQLASVSAYFQNECTLHIVKRLNRLFEERQLASQKEYIFLRRALLGCIALGEYSFRELIPYIYKLPADDIPEFLWNDFASSALYLKGKDDIFLYEWLSHVCGSDKLLPFMTYFAQYYKRLNACRERKSKNHIYYIYPKISIRRLNWKPSSMAQTISASHKSQGKLLDLYSEFSVPNLRKQSITINVPGFQAITPQLRRNFDFKNNVEYPSVMTGVDIKMFNSPQHYASPSSYEIVLARRRLLKPLTNEHRNLTGSDYHFLTI